MFKAGVLAGRLSGDTCHANNARAVRVMRIALICIQLRWDKEGTKSVNEWQAFDLAQGGQAVAGFGPMGDGECRCRWSPWTWDCWRGSVRVSGRSKLFLLLNE